MKRALILSVLLLAAPALWAKEEETLKKFIPDISLTFDASYAFRSLSDGTYADSSLPGFVQSPEGMHGNNGFNINAVDINLASLVDPYFCLSVTLHTSPQGVEIEEAWARTTSLPAGFQITLGKFLSGFGRANGHSWSFADQNLPYMAILGEGGLGELGIQVSWYLPVSAFIIIGFEVLEGANDQSLGTGSFKSDPAATGSFRESEPVAPNAYAFFVKTSFEKGNVTVMTGASGLFGWRRVNRNAGTDTPGNYGIKAETWLANYELTARWNVDRVRYLELQGEYVFRSMTGTRYGYDGSGNVISGDEDSLQSGFYAQLVGKILPWMRLGTRFGMLFTHRKEEGGTVTTDNYRDLYRLSVMTDVLPSDYSLFRLQYSYDMSRDVHPNHEVIVQANLTIASGGELD
jgi:hypothetical protein